jgi:hypothetical protein
MKFLTGSLYDRIVVIRIRVHCLNLEDIAAYVSVNLVGDFPRVATVRKTGHQDLPGS